MMQGVGALVCSSLPPAVATDRRRRDGDSRDARPMPEAGLGVRLPQWTLHVQRHEGALAQLPRG